MANVEDVESKSGSGENDEKQLGEEIKVKIICIGDSAVGKSKLMERFLIDGYKPQQSSTYALTTFNYQMKVNGQKVSVDFWDTAGQERFSTLHRSYYHQAHACIMVFDATRKITYKNLSKWLTELQEHRPNIPCLCAANKIDADMNMTKKSFNFPEKHKMPLYFVSAANGTNVVKLFTDAIEAAVGYKLNTTDFLDKVMRELENFDVEDEGNLSLTDEQKKI
ncbi:rab-like protein 2A [Octopus bimaculoides]|uniref:Rab-like protein 2A n=1 Tax=Octopus bimaculoides TaxID=37653 RepID=A0A0L8H4F0_OCTBM|nr:rab-like protein 2A [Octopus bimaculoides]|eukprot:XP_014775816.1 PREDICTED: rab-like protein 2A [Octopus bimaculoides]